MNHDNIEVPTLDALQTDHLLWRALLIRRMTEAGAVAKVMDAVSRFCLPRLCWPNGETLMAGLLHDQLFTTDWYLRSPPDRDLVTFAVNAALANFHGLKPDEAHCTEFTWVNGNPVLTVKPEHVFLRCRIIPLLALGE